jgi:hypothetical protein
MKIVTLTDEQWALLLRILESHEDRGPMGEGWQSPELSELVGVVSRSPSGDSA